MTTTTTTAAIEMRDADGRVTRHPLSAGHLVLGRSEAADLQLPADTVSRRHAELYCDPFDRWWIRDLGSHNGTFVNSQRVTEQVLHHDDLVQIGDFSLRLVTAASRHASTLHPDVTAPYLRAEADRSAISSLRQVEPPHIATTHLATLNTFGEQLIGTADPEARLRLLCGLVVRDDFPGRFAAALRLDRHGDLARPTVLCPAQTRDGGDEAAAHISRTLLRAVLEAHEPVLASNVKRSEASVELSLAATVRPMSAIACPLREDDEAMDVLYATLPPEYGTGEWLALVSLAARQYQQAELAWAGRKQGEALAAIERELEQARRLQLGLVPKDPKVPGLDTAIAFEPCRWVGGDYADVLPLRDGRVLVTVADVCGKGMQAALTTSCLHTMVHAGARANLALADPVAGLNEHLEETLPDASFVTMVMLMIDPDTGELTCINAGHPPAFVLSSAGTLRRLQEAENPPLGIMRFDYGTQQDRLAPGEALMLFTDGLTELNNEAGEMLGLDGLGDELLKLWRPAPDMPARDYAEQVMTRMHAIRGSGITEDDYTFLIARRGT